MTRYLALAILALLAACSGATGGYTVAQARGDLVAIQKIRADVLRIEIAYVNQPPCGQPASPPPPLCASYSVALTMQQANRTAGEAIAYAKMAIDAGASIAAIKAAVDSARGRLADWQAVVTSATATK